MIIISAMIIVIVIVIIVVVIIIVITIVVIIVQPGPGLCGRFRLTPSPRTPSCPRQLLSLLSLL